MSPGRSSRTGPHSWSDWSGGIRPGQVIDQTDREGGLPVTAAYTPADLAATIFHLIGVGPDEEFHDTQGRPYRIYRGQPIRSLV